jgi:ABC-type branched-subunit amino acid transport system substrate-binding protein
MTFSAPRPQARRLFLTSVLAAAVLSAAGCHSGPREVRVPQPRAPQVHNVAVLVPLTGEDAAVGQSIANAARLALADSGNAAIRLAVYDTNEGGAAAAAAQAIASGNRLILGPLLAEQVRAVAPIARSARVPVIAYSNDVTVAGNGVYLLGFVPGQSIERVMRHARQAGATRFAGLMPSNVYGQRSMQALLAGAQRIGAQVVRVETYGRAEEARAAARRLNASGGFDAVLFGDTGRIAALAAPQIKAGPRLLGTAMWANDPALGKTPRLRGAWYAAAPDTRFQQLSGHYRARYGKAPTRLASLGYDSVLLTVRAARNWPPGRRFPERVLMEDEGFAGVDGIFRFGRDGVAQRAFEVRQVTAGGTVVVSPAPTSF